MFCRTAKTPAKTPWFFQDRSIRECAMHYGCFQQMTQFICALQRNFIIMAWDKGVCVCVCVGGEGGMGFRMILHMYIWRGSKTSHHGPTVSPIPHQLIQKSKHSHRINSTFQPQRQWRIHSVAENQPVRTNRLIGPSEIDWKASGEWHGSVKTHAQSRDNHVRGF